MWPTPALWVTLIGSGIAGGIGQILITEAYRQAEVSVIAPFEYTSLVLSLIVGYLVFSDVPTVQMLIGAADRRRRRASSSSSASTRSGSTAARRAK